MSDSEESVPQPGEIVSTPGADVYVPRHYDHRHGHPPDHAVRRSN